MTVQGWSAWEWGCRDVSGWYLWYGVWGVGGCGVVWTGDSSLMSFFSKIISRVYESVVEDDFSQLLTQHQVLSVINHQRNTADEQSSFLHPPSPTHPTILQMAQAISELSPDIEFRLLGNEPSVEAIADRVGVLKSKLDALDCYLLQHYNQYVLKLGRSVGQLQELKQFYCGRKKAQEARGAMERLKLGLDRARKITRLNIHANNIKSTIKLLEKIPSIKKMTLRELKAIDLQALADTNRHLALKPTSPKTNSLKPTSPQLALKTSSRLLCIDHLCNYINKVNNQEFVFIIDKIKLALEHFEEASYEELVRTFLVINPSTSLQKILSYLLEAQLRLIADMNFETSEQINKIAYNVVKITINLHKLLKWHKINKAVSSNLKNTSTVLQGGSASADDAKLPEQQQTRNRQLSTDSNYSEQGSNIEVTQIIILEPSALKAVFANTLDSCLSDLVDSQVLGPELEAARLYHYIYAISRIGEICENFTGMQLHKVSSVIMEYVRRRELALFLKSAREVSLSLQNQRNEWNRLPFRNDYRYKNMDKLVYKAERMREIEEFRWAYSSISNMLKPTQNGLTIAELLDQRQQDNQKEEWQLKPIRLPSFEKCEKGFEQWSPPADYLQQYEGDTILSQSSLKLLAAFEKHFQLMIATAALGQAQSHLQHLLLLVQYYIFYIFVSFLSPPYKRLFFEPYNPTEALDKKYTKKRLTYLYPELSEFATAFRNKLYQGSSPDSNLYSNFKRDIKQVAAQTNQTLRGKVVATESCRFALTYFEEMMKRVLGEKQLESRAVYGQLKKTKALLREVCVLLLTESSQKMVAGELQGMKYVLQTVRWSEPFEQLTEYVAKLTSLARESFQRLKSSSRGQIPATIVYRIFVLVWRTLVTYSIKVFLESKGNNRAESKRNFKMFISEMYREFHNPLNLELRQLDPAYQTFLSIFQIIDCKQGERSRSLLLETTKRYQYIFPIVMALLQNCQQMQSLTDPEKENERSKFKRELESALDEELL